MNWKEEEEGERIYNKVLKGTHSRFKK